MIIQVGFSCCWRVSVVQTGSQLGKGIDFGARKRSENSDPAGVDIYIYMIYTTSCSSLHYSTRAVEFCKAVKHSHNPLKGSSLASFKIWLP